MTGRPVEVCDAEAVERVGHTQNIRNPKPGDANLFRKGPDRRYFRLLGTVVCVLTTELHGVKIGGDCM